MRDDLDGQVAAMGALSEPTRRALYLHVARQPAPVSREQAADAVGVPLHTVKFHLDRLVAEGLLEVEFRRLTGRRGPGAGRPAKLYRRSAREVSVSLPARHYDLAGEVLARAVERAIHEGEPIADAVREVAGREGRRIATESATEDLAASTGEDTGMDSGEASREDAAERSGSALKKAARVLARWGYQPRVDAGHLRLENCPFHRLATAHTELVCGMNLALVDGVLAGLELTGPSAHLDPQPGSCCVRIRG